MLRSRTSPAAESPHTAPFDHVVGDAGWSHQCALLPTTALSVKLLREAAVAGRSEGADSVNLAVEESGLLLRIVRDLRRVHSHLASVAFPVLRRTNRKGPRRANALRDEPERLE